MNELMDWLFESLTLRARASRGPALSGAERARLIALGRALELRDRNASAARNTSESSEDHGVPVQLTAPGGFETARMVSAGAQHLRLQLNRPLRPGASTVVRVIVPRGGVEYTFPCVVERVEGKEMTVRFDGAPGRTPLREALSVGWKRPLDLRTGWGRKTEIAAA